MVRVEELDITSTALYFPKRRREAALLSWDEFRNLMVFYKTLGIAYTFWEGESIIGVGGAVHVNNCNGQVWLNVSDDINKCPVSFTKCCKKLFNEYRDRFHRLQTDVPVRDLNATKWLEVLGFHKESVMKHYYKDKSDAYMMVKIWE